MRAINSAVKNNKVIRKEIFNTFRKKGDTGYDLYNLYDEIYDETV